MPVASPEPLGAKGSPRAGRYHGTMSEQQLIRIVCPNLVCLRIIAVSSNTRGKLVRCRKCGTTVRIPSQPQPKPQVTS